MLRTSGYVEVGHVAPVHALLDGEVEHRLLVAVLNAGDTCLVALLVVELHGLDNADGYVLERRLHVAEHELLAVQQNLLHHLAIDRDVAVVVDLGTRYALDKLLNRRALRRAVSIGVIDQRVLLHDDLCGTARYHRLAQHDCVRRHNHFAQLLVLVAPQRHLALDGLETYRRNLQPVDAVSRSHDREVSPNVGHRSAHEGRVTLSEQLYRRLHKRLFQFCIIHRAADRQSTVFVTCLSLNAQYGQHHECQHHSYFSCHLC